MVRALDPVMEPGNDVNSATERAFLKLNVRIIQHTDMFMDCAVTAPATVTDLIFT